MTRNAYPQNTDHAAITENLRAVRPMAYCREAPPFMDTVRDRTALALTRRHALMGAALGLAAPAAFTGRARAADPFSHADVQAKAAELARRPYQAPERPQGPAAAIDYDLYRQLSFRRERALWASSDLPFHADFLAAGYLFSTPVALFEVAEGAARPIPFAANDYDAPAALAAVLQSSAGHSGLRLQHPINDPGKFDEIAVFQGASYFRSLGRDQGYGISARGIALGAGAPREEFPAFRALWVERPRVDSVDVVVHALMDGPSLTGAYRFVIRPGQTTVFDVEAALYPRRTIEDAGVAAASSMYMFGSADRVGHDDFRSAVHDSDGLEIWTGDNRRIWRPLSNPRRLQISSFAAASPRGFGLMQRARGLEDFGDLEARYDRRPSLWVEPVGDWGPGEVRLVEIPTGVETMDNIVASWRPARPWQAGEVVKLAYRLHWGVSSPPAPVARAVRTLAGGSTPPGGRVFAVDFKVPEGANLAAVGGVAGSTAGVAGPVALTPYPAPGMVRASFRFDPPATGGADIDLRLTGANGDLSETWRFRWTA